MLQLRPGDLVAVKNDGGHVVAAILTKQVLFGGHWSFVFHGTWPQAPENTEFDTTQSGFNAAVDFIFPKREGRLTRISRGNDFAPLKGPELMSQAPLPNMGANYRIWKWKGGRREDATFVRFTPNPTKEELTAPPYGCLAADFVWKLAARSWLPGEPMYDPPNTSLERTRER